MYQMKKFMGAAMLAGASIAGIGAANAETTASVAMTTDYVWRGISQSDGNFAVQGSFDYSNDMFYAGAWASSVDDFGVDATSELDLYVGFTPSAGPVDFDIGLLGYFYPGADDIDFLELMVGASISASEELTFGASAYLANDFGNTGSDALYLEVNSAYAFSEETSVSGAYGNQDVDLFGEYDTWNIGVSHAMHGFTLDLRYHDTDGLGADEIFNLTVSRSL
jgi:uncharacterized protein (TIGR02001 family)